jgi:hypothetical protein
MREIRIYTENTELRELFRNLKSYKIAAKHGDGRKRRGYIRGVDNSIEKIEKFGINYLNIGNNENIVKVKVFYNKIYLKLKV